MKKGVGWGVDLWDRGDQKMGKNSSTPKVPNEEKIRKVGERQLVERRIERKKNKEVGLMRKENDGHFYSLKVERKFHA